MTTATARRPAHQFLDRFDDRRRRRPHRKSPLSGFRPLLERLEDRLTPSLTSVFEIETNANAVDQSILVTALPDDWNSALQVATPNPITNNPPPSRPSHAVP